MYCMLSGQRNQIRSCNPRERKMYSKIGDKANEMAWATRICAVDRVRVAKETARGTAVNESNTCNRRYFLLLSRSSADHVKKTGGLTNGRQRPNIRPTFHN
jgi:hypothetical protein